jgi:putative endonuclease
MQYFVYILTNKKEGVLYIGVTSNLVKRVFEHKSKYVEGFSEKYNLTRLVYYEMVTDVNSAIEREKQLKKWNRDWKVRLINSFNRNWDDLYPLII